jgi:hypothetical protein
MIEAVAVDPAARALLDGAALRCAETLVAWAEAHAAEHDVRFCAARLRYWQSREDPSDEHAVIDISVEADAESALAFADAVSTHLGELTERCSSPAAAKLWVEVRWH